MNFKKIGKRIIIFIIFSILFYLLVFTSGNFIFNKFSNDGRESFIAAITFFSVFATFGGAYLGAKISGDNALHNIKRQNYIDKVDKLKALQSEILFNMNYLGDFLSNVYAPLGFSLKKVKIELESFDRGTEHFYLKIYNKLVKNDLTKIEIDQNFYLNLLLLKDVINSNSREYRLFDEIFPNDKKKFFNIDKFYKLKQNIDNIKNFITVEEHYSYIHLNTESKQYIISLYDFAIQINDILVKSPPTKDNV